MTRQNETIWLCKFLVGFMSLHSSFTIQMANYEKKLRKKCCVSLCVIVKNYDLVN